MKTIECNICRQVWTYDNSDEDETVYTVCEMCRNKETCQKLAAINRHLGLNPNLKPKRWGDKKW